MLIRDGLISREQLERGLQDARSNGTRIGYSLVKLGFVVEQDLALALSKQLGIPAVDLERVKLDPKLVKLIPAEIALKHLVLPVRRVGGKLTVAVADPSERIRRIRGLDDRHLLADHRRRPRHDHHGQPVGPRRRRLVGGRAVGRPGCHPEPGADGRDRARSLTFGPDIDYTRIVLDPNPGREMALFAATRTTTTDTSAGGIGKARAR